MRTRRLQMNRTQRASRQACASNSRRRSLSAVLALALASQLVPHAASAGPHYSAADRDIPAPIEAVWAELADMQSWSAFTPGLQRIVGGAVDGETRRVRFEVKSHGFALHYWANIEMQREQGIVRIELDHAGGNDIDALSTRWHLTPTDDGRGTRVELVSHFKSGMPIPGFIEGHVLQSSIEATLEGLAEQVAERTL
jgi:carbon monoxide dehydrogenase subunit G